MSCPHEHTVIKYDCDGLPDPLELSWLECLDCDAWLPMGPSNDRIPAREMQLAEELADIHLLWEPGAERRFRIEATVDIISSLDDCGRSAP